MKFLGSDTFQTLPTIAGSIRCNGLGTPAAPTVTPNATGATTYTYRVVAVDNQGQQTAASLATTITNGPATLDATHTITVTWAAPAGTAYVTLVRTTGGTSQGAIAVAGTPVQFTPSGTYTDSGASTFPFTLPTVDNTGSITASAYVSANTVQAQKLYLQNSIPVSGALDKQTSVGTFNTLSTASPTTIFSVNVPGNTIGASGCLRVTIWGDMLDNSGTPSWTFAVTYGGQTLWKDTSPTFGASTIRQPWRLEFILANQGNTAAQWLGGTLFIGAGIVATTGEGDISAVAKLANPIYGSATADSTAAQTLAVTVQPSVSSASVEITVRYAITEVMP